MGFSVVKVPKRGEFWFVTPDRPNTQLILAGKISELTGPLAPEDLKVEGVIMPAHQPGKADPRDGHIVPQCSLLPLLPKETLADLILKGGDVVIDEIISLLFITKNSFYDKVKGDYYQQRPEAYYQGPQCSNFLDPELNYGEAEASFISSLTKRLRSCYAYFHDSSMPKTDEDFIYLLWLSAKFVFQKLFNNPKKALAIVLSWIYGKEVVINPSIDDRLIRTLNSLLTVLIRSCSEENLRILFPAITQPIRDLLFFPPQKTEVLEKSLDLLAKEFEEQKLFLTQVKSLRAFLFFIKFYTGLHCDRSPDDSLKHLEDLLKTCPKEVEFDFSLFDDFPMNHGQRFRLLKCKSSQIAPTAAEFEALITKDAALNDSVVKFLQSSVKTPNQKTKALLEKIAKAGSVRAWATLAEYAKRGQLNNYCPDYPEALRCYRAMADLNPEAALSGIRGILNEQSISPVNQNSALNALENIVVKQACAQLKADKTCQEKMWKSLKPFVQLCADTAKKYWLFYFFETQYNWTDRFGDCPRDKIIRFCEKTIQDNKEDCYIAHYLLANIYKADPQKSAHHAKMAQEKLFGLSNDNNHADPLREFIQSELERKNRETLAQMSDKDRLTLSPPPSYSMFSKSPPAEVGTNHAAETAAILLSSGGVPFFARPSAPPSEDFNTTPSTAEYKMLKVLRKNGIQTAEQLEEILEKNAQSETPTLGSPAQ